MLHNCKYKDLIKWLDVWWHHKTIYFPPCCTSISCIIISKLGHRGHTPVWCPWRVGSHAEVIIWTWGKGLIVQRVLIHHYRRSSVLRLPGIFFWPPEKKKMCMVLLNWIYLVNIFNWINWNHLKFLPILLETWIGKNATVDEICENFPPRTKLALFLWASLDNATSC